MRIYSINASGHKYGMSSVGVGWIIWRGAEYLPKDLIFELHYLGAVGRLQESSSQAAPADSTADRLLVQLELQSTCPSDPLSDVQL